MSFVSTILQKTQIFHGRLINDRSCRTQYLVDHIHIIFVLRLEYLIPPHIQKPTHSKYVILANYDKKKAQQKSLSLFSFIL